MTTTRPDARYLLAALRTAAREAVWWATCRHEQGPDPNILLFATRRGGSTFAMELIGANRGVRPMNQPLETLSPNLTAAQWLDIPHFHEGQITSLDDADAERLAALMERIFTGRAVINAPTRFWAPDFPMRSNRLVLKITDAKPVIDWFASSFPVDIVYLTRHPVPKALSCIRNRWTLTVDAHLRDPAFVDRYLADAAVALAHDTMAHGTDLQRFVVNWALENAAPAQLIGARPEWMHVRYEDCVADPSGTLERLADRLALTDLDRMHAVLSRPSQSSARSTDATRQTITSGRGADTLERWRADVDPDDEAWCHKTLETFGIAPELVV